MLITVAFVAIIAVYFSPLVFKGLAMRQSDAGQWSGSSAEVTNYRKATGEEALWTNAMFAGMPAYTVSVVYPGEMLVKIEKVLHLGLPYPASILLVALICYYILMIALGYRPLLAAMGAVAFTFFTFTFVSIETGHNSKVRAMAMAPLLIAGIALMYKDRRWLGFGLAALGMGLQIGGGHYQITYYLAMFCVFMGAGYLVEAIRSKQLPKFIVQTLLLVVAAGLGTAANAGKLLQLQEYAKYSMRGKTELTKVADANKPTDGGLDRDYVFNWSNGKLETFTLLIPGFYGGGSSEQVSKKSEVASTLKGIGADVSAVPNLPYYWGSQPFTSGPVYAGAIVIFLAVLGFFFMKGSTKYWLGAAILFSIALSWGKNFDAFNYAMYDFFPAYKQFRAVTMAIVILQWALPWLAVAGLSAFVDSLEASGESEPEKAAKTKKLYIAGGIVGGLALLFAIIPSLAGDFISANDAQLPEDLKKALYNAILADRESMLQGDAMRSFILIAIAVAALFALSKGWLKTTVVFPVLGVLVLGDLWSVNQRYLNKDSYDRNFYTAQFAPTPADQMMMANPYGSYRVLNLQNPFSESRTSYYHQSLGGYSPVKLRRYQDLIEGPLSAEIQAVPQLLGSARNIDSAFGQLPIINMLNAKFLKYGDEADKVIVNPRACGNAWFVGSVRTVANPDAEYAAIAKFDPKAEAIVDASKFKTKATLYNTQGAGAQLASYNPKRLEYDATTPGPGLLVMSENYYEAGWYATIDGKPADIIRVDYTLRAIEVPEGRHKIICTFDPPSYKLGNSIATAASILIFGILGFVGFMSVRGAGKSEN